MDIKQILLFVFIFVIGCSSPTSLDSIPIVDIEKFYNQTCDIFLSDFSTDEVEYIPLETHTDGLFTYGTMYASDKYIVVRSFPITMLFDRQTGKFIRQIARQGPGFNDHYSFNYNYPFDENSLTFQYPSAAGVIEYDIEGNVIRKINITDEDARLSFIPIDEYRYATYKNNIPGDEPVKMYIFDYDGNKLKTFPNHHSFDINLAKSWSGGGFLAYKWRNNVFFYENCVDTLYKISEDNNLIPYFHFKLGKFNPPYSEKPFFYSPPNMERPPDMNYIMFYQMNESDRFLFFSFRHDRKDRRWKWGYEGMPVSKYFGLYDKQTGETKISAEDHTDKSPVINDIDDFAPVYPYYSSINQSGEFVVYMEAAEILDWFKQNPEKAQKLPEHLQAFSKLQFDDNPVVVIAKLKK